MKKLICLISTVAVLVGFSVPAATLNEWSFDSDPAGKTLSNAYNSVSSTAFALNAGYSDSDLQTDNTGYLLCTHNDPGTTGMWTNGAMLSANLGTNITSGIQYLRYDFSYDLSDTNILNDSGSVVGFAFTDSTSNKIVGVALQYDVGATTNAPYQATELTNMTDTVGSVAVIAKVNLDLHTLDVWYSLTGNVSGFSSNSPMKTVSSLTLSSFDSLQFQATGDIQPVGSTNQVKVDLLRTADTWGDITAVPDPVPAAKYANEWTFERDIEGRSLSQTINSGTNSPLAQFSSGGTDVYTTNRQYTTPPRILLCTGDDTTPTGVWTNGAILDASLTTSSSGVHYLRYDVDYSLTNSLNDSGSVLGVYFTGDTGNNAAGLVLGYDTGTPSNNLPAGLQMIVVPTNNGSLIAIAEVNLDTHVLKGWYSLDGSNPTNYAAPAFTNSLGLTAITNLRFHATGDFRPAGSTDYAAVDNIRHTIGATAGGSAWSEVIEPVADLSPPPELTTTLSDSLSGGMELGETNLMKVVISNTGRGVASGLTSTLTASGTPGDFTITSNNTSVTLSSGSSVTNTYTVIANTEGGPFVFTAQAVCNETNSAPVTLDLVVGSHVGYLTNSISEPGGTYPGFYEPGETLNITITSTNDGSRAVSNIVNTLTATSAGFTITPPSYSYPALGTGEATSSVYQVVIGTDVTNGTYTFNVTNSSGASTWSSNFTFDVFTRQPNSDWVKANNTNNLNLASSWTSGLVPNSTDRAVLDSTVTANINTALGTDLSWRGIALVSNTASWTISGTNTLTTGSAGIDMSQAQEDLTVASKLALATTQTWNVATSRTLTVSGEISGTNTAPLVKSGAGTLVVTNTANNYSGNILVSGGTLSVANANVLGTGTLTLNDSALATTDSASLTNNTVLTGSVSISNANELTLSGIISGSGSLTKTGGETLILRKSNTYSGGTTNNKTIQIRRPTSLGTGNVVMNDGSVIEFYAASTSPENPFGNDIELFGSCFFQPDSATESPTINISGNITGTGSLTLSSFQCQLYGNASFSGGLTLNVDNWIFIYSTNALGSGGITLSHNTLLRPRLDMEIANDINMGSNLIRLHAEGHTLTLSGQMSGTGTLQCSDATTGTIIITGDNSNRVSDTVWKYEVLRLGHRNALGVGTVTGTGGGSYGGLEVTKDLTGTNSVANDFNLNTLPINPDSGETEPFIFNLDHNLELSGTFTCAGDSERITYKKGAGALIFSGTVTNGGQFKVQSGLLTVNDTFISYNLDISSGATLSGSGAIGTVEGTVIESDSTLDISSGSMLFAGDLTMNEGSLTKLTLTNAASALYGAGNNTLTAAGTLKIDFTGNATAIAGATFTVFNNWGTLTDNGLQVFSFGLPPFLKLDTSNLFVNGTVTVISADRLNTQAIEITVPQNGTGSGSVILSNSTAGTLSFTAQADGSWPLSSYQITQSANQEAAIFLPAQFERASTITNWNGNSSAVMNLGFTFPLYGTEYTTFSINRYGAITLGGATDGSNPGVLPYGSNPVIAPFWGSTLIATNSIRFRHESDHLVVAWNNNNGTNKEFQAWIYDNGSIRYVYPTGVTGSSIIGMQNGTFYTRGHTTSAGSLLITPNSWVSNAPDTGVLSPHQTQTVTFTADGTGRTLGDYFFAATVLWDDGQTSDIGVFITVTADTSELGLLPSPLTFFGPAGYITQTNLVVTNGGSAALSYIITDSGMQGAGYTLTNTAYSWVYIPPTTGYILSSSQLGSKALNIGFPFIFFGNIYTSLTANANGTLTLGSGQTISPFGADLSLDDNTSVRFFPNPEFNQFAVTWENIAQSGGGNNQTFQAVLNRDGTILFNYQNLGNGWTNGVIQLVDSSGTVSGTLSNATTTVTSNTVEIIGTNVVENPVGSGIFSHIPIYQTNVVTTYKATVNSQSLKFTPGALRIISALPTSGTISGGGSTNIIITGDARSLTRGGSNNITNSTTLSFSYSGFTTNALVTFIATNSTDTAYPSAAAVASAASVVDMWGGNPNVTYQPNPEGHPAGSYMVSWTEPNDGLTRIYTVWFSTNLIDAVWHPTPLAVLTNTYFYVDTIHTNEPQIYYKVTVQ